MGREERIQQLLKDAEKAFLSENFDDARRAYEQVTQFAAPDGESYKKAISGVAFTAAMQSQFEEARGIYDMLLNVSRMDKHPQTEAMILHQLGIVERLAGDHIAALDYLQQEETVLHEKLPDWVEGLAANSYEQGYVHYKQGGVTLAKKFFLKTVHEAALTVNDAVYHLLGAAFRVLGEIAQKEGTIESAREYYTRSIEAFQNDEDSQAVQDVQKQLDMLG